MRTVLIATATLLAGLVVGLAAGFFVGRSFPAAGQPAGAGQAPPGAQPAGTPAAVLSQQDALRSITHSGEYDVYYAQPFAAPPALEVVDPEKAGWWAEVTEQRADGFKLKVNIAPNKPEDSPLRYTARGRQGEATLVAEAGEALVPLADGGKPGEVEVFYRGPFASPPYLTFPDGLQGCTVADQKAGGFKLVRATTSGSATVKVKWRAEATARK